MSKQIKQMEMGVLKKTFEGVHDMVLVSISGVDATAENQMRLALRKKNIRMQMVKNSLCRRVFDELGLKLNEVWTSPTVVAWGAGSLAELSRELDGLFKKNEKIKVKTAVSEGQPLTFQQALTMPTKAEAIGRILSLILSPAGRLVSQLSSPGGKVAAQVKTISEKSPEPAAPAAAPPAG
jgi:large subunit ribosomal protein L10